MGQGCEGRQCTRHPGRIRLCCDALSRTTAIADRSGFTLDLARRYWAVTLYVLCAASLVFWIGYEASTTRLITFSQGADYWEHSAALHALIESPFSPGNPHLRSPALSPRYHPLYVLVALVSRALHLNAIDAMGLAAVLNMLLFTGGVFWFFSTYFRDWRAPLYALLVLFTSWWRGWHFSNVYQLQILPSVAAYPSTTGLALSWFCFGAVLTIIRRGPSPARFIVLGLLACLVLLAHPLTAMAVFSGMACLAVFEPGAPWRLRLLVLLTLVAGALLSHFWPYYSPFEVLSGRQGRVAGWAQRAIASAASDSPGPEQPLFYQVKGLRDALGLAAPGLLFAALMLALRKHLFAPLGLLSMLVVFATNMYVPLPLGHRFVLLAMVFLHIATVWGWLKLTPGYHDAWRFVARPWVGLVTSAALILLFVVGLWHNVALAEGRVQQAARGVSPVLNYARQVGKKAGSDAVVLGTNRDSWPVPTFGPKVVALLHANPLVADDLDRYGDATYFFSRMATSAERDAIIGKYSVTHVLTGAGVPKALRNYLGERGKSQRLASGLRLYTLAPAP
jgi:hypothetical protein